MSVDVDFLVIGSGLAGLTYALTVAQHGSVALLTKKSRSDANSSWAQGGIAGVLSEGDSFALHVQDTLVAGAGLCREEAVEILVREGPERIRDLIRLGAQFNTETDDTGNEVLSLGREGGHSRNRIVHTADYTGWECERTLLDAVKARPEIVVYEHYFVTDLAMAEGPEGEVCVGAHACNSESGGMELFRARATMLATGGCGQVYEHTTNPLVATGDGVAIAWRAGAVIANMEFIQFHPTTLYHPEARAFLITEALRGEGAILCHADGETFMERYHPLRELAPRDIVARAIDSEIKRRGVKCVYLDATGLSPDLIKGHFPTVYERCLAVGIDITTMPIPIVPAQHYQCGGVVTDMDGATSIPRLYASGEVACTGVHGANRLASNSLLEAMVFGYRAARHTLAQAAAPGLPGIFTDSAPAATANGGEFGAIAETRQTIRETMQRHVGIVRSNAELEAAASVIRIAGIALDQSIEPSIEPSIDESLGQSNHAANDRSVEWWEARNIATVADLIVRCAALRHESRGLHFTLDYPEKDEAQRHDTIVVSRRPGAQRSKIVGGRDVQ